MKKIKLSYTFGQYLLKKTIDREFEVRPLDMRILHVTQIVHFYSRSVSQSFLFDFFQFLFKNVEILTAKTKNLPYFRIVKLRI